MAFSQTRKQMQERIDSQIVQILTGEQRRQFDQYKRLRDSGLPPQMIDRPEALKTAALKIQTLSDVQKNGIEAAFERYDRGSAHADEVTKSALAEQFATEVLATLKPSQKVLLTSQAMMDAGGRGGPGSWCPRSPRRQRRSRRQCPRRWRQWRRCPPDLASRPVSTPPALIVTPSGSDSCEMPNATPKRTTLGGVLFLWP